jgi:hypothetical protein
LYAEGGFADRRTVFPGDSLTFYVASYLHSAPAGIVRMGDDGRPRPMTKLELTAMNSPEAACTPGDGCDWKPTTTFEVPPGWPSGWYRLTFPVREGEQVRYVDFVVASRKPTARALFVLDYQTAEAYNVYGGASFYGRFDATGRWYGRGADCTYSISFRRPLLRSHTYAASADRIATPVWRPHEGDGLRKWLDTRMDLDYVSNDALERLGSAFLARYPLVVVTGTQEYLSDAQISLLSDYVRSGGNLLLGSTEFGYGVVRHDEPDRLVYTAVRDHSAEFADFFGISWEWGKRLEARGFQPMRVVNAEHWAFRDSGFVDGDKMSNVAGFAAGAWVVRRSDGRYCLASSRLPCDQVELLAVADYPHIEPVDGHAQTSGILALVRQGAGRILVAPAWIVAQHESSYDTRTKIVMANVVDRLSGARP